MKPIRCIAVTLQASYDTITNHIRSWWGLTTVEKANTFECHVFMRNTRLKSRIGALSYSHCLLILFIYVKRGEYTDMYMMT